MQRLFVGMAIAVMSMTLGAWAGDVEIAEQIISKLKHQRDTGALKGFNIDLKVHDGVVILKGKVSSSQQHALILQAANEAEGLKDIVDELQLPGSDQVAKDTANRVSPQIEPAKPITIEAVKNNGEVVAPESLTEPMDKPRTQLVTAIEPVDAGQSSEVQAVKPQPIVIPMTRQEDADRVLNAAITRALTLAKNEGRVRGFAMDVTTNSGDVWLQGRTVNSEQRDNVLDVVRSVPGVRNVVDKIHVMTPVLDDRSMIRQASDSIPTVSQAQPPHPTALESLPPQPTTQVAESVGPRPTSLKTLPTRPLANPTMVEASRSNVSRQEPMQSIPVAQAVSQPIMQRGPARLVPVPYRRNATPQPYAMASGMQVAAQGVPAYSAQPVPMQAASASIAYGAPRYDQPNLPNYAWPGYSAYPNYAALAYPKQYSPSAWPFIGPFYPYPQVPLNWRKVTLQWDDGWWFLDYSSKSR